MTMAAYAARRTFFYIVVFFVVSFLIFFTIHALVDRATFDNVFLRNPAALASDRHILPIYPPVWVQYVRWLGGFFTGDLGSAFNTYGR